jgi:SET domain-containing protein
MTSTGGRQPPPFRVRRSKIHGRGVFAARRIRKGTRIVEYVGERVTHAEADRRYEDRPIDDNHTLLFIVDARTVIDAGVRGNAARFINHSCAPNCETLIEDGRVFIRALRGIEAGEELSYDYQIKRERGDPPDIDAIFACRCGAPDCRGTMLAGPKPARRRKAPGRAARQLRERHAHGRSSSRH